MNTWIAVGAAVGVITATVAGIAMVWAFTSDEWEEPTYDDDGDE